MKILITGIQGFAGSYLAKYVIENNLAEVHGIVREKKENELLEELKEIKSRYCDITEKEKLEKIIKKIKPEIIFHLAAQASVANSLINPKETFETNLFGTMNVLEAVKNSNKKTKVIWIG